MPQKVAKSVFTHSDFTVPDPNNLPIPSNHLDSVNLTEQEVFDALSNLNPNKASGIDNIPPIVLKKCAHVLVIPIHHLFETSINSGTIPSEWKIHKIVPVYKSGDKTTVKNYRQISLLCIGSKVLERLIYDKIIYTVAASTTPYQFGFQKNTSTKQQLLTYVRIFIYL